MQTLGLSDSTAQSESRLKSLFWPSIQSANDVDYLGSQGHWVCVTVGLWTCLVTALQGHWIAGVFSLLFYYVGGMGVRERSRYAASVILAFFVMDVIAGIAMAGPVAIGSASGVIRVIILGLLVSNLRATWIVSRWKPDSPEAALPPRFNATWGEKIGDQLPMRVWPKIRILYYIFSGCYLLLVVLGLVGLALRRTG
jgi:hypothetical protein